MCKQAVNSDFVHNGSIDHVLLVSAECNELNLSKWKITNFVRYFPYLSSVLLNICYSVLSKNAMEEVEFILFYRD